MLDCNIFPGLGQNYLATEVNMFLLPVQENDGEDGLTKAGFKELSSQKAKPSCPPAFFVCVCVCVLNGNWSLFHV